MGTVVGIGEVLVGVVLAIAVALKLSAGPDDAARAVLERLPRPCGAVEQVSCEP